MNKDKSDNDNGIHCIREYACFDGIRDDNRIENLELWSKAQPSGQRVEDKIKWCKEFLKEYEITSID